jgi:hypothetical protein
MFEGLDEAQMPLSAALPFSGQAPGPTVAPSLAYRIAPHGIGYFSGDTIDLTDLLLCEVIHITAWQLKARDYSSRHHSWR